LTSGCSGGGLLPTWLFLEHFGVYTDGCIPYLSFMGDEIPCVFSHCFDDSQPVKFFAKNSSTHIFADKNSMKIDLMTNGPVFY